MVLPSSSGQGTHRAACQSCLWIAYLSLVQLATKLAGDDEDSLKKGVGSRLLRETVQLETTLHVQYIVTPTATPR